MSGPHFIINRYPGRIHGTPVTPIGWIVMIGYLSITSLLVFIPTTLFFSPEKSPIQFFIVATLATLAIIWGFVLIMFRLGEVIDHR